MRKLIIIIFLFSCSNYSILKKIEKGEIKVFKKLYPFQTYEIKEQELKLLAEKLKDKISKNPEIFNYVTDKFYNITSTDFKFRVSKIDTLRHMILLRYFSPLREKIFAGIIIEFLFSLKGELKEIYVYKIPLE